MGHRHQTHTLMRLIFACLAASQWPAHVQAQEVPTQFYTTRPTAVGGAFTAIANDENAVWTNPAGIARIRKARSRFKLHMINFPNVVGGTNSNGTTFYEAIQAEQEDGSDLTTVSENAANIAEKPLWANGSAFPLVKFDIGSFPTAIGAFVHTTIQAATDSEVPDQVDTDVISDIGGLLTMAYTTKTNRFNVGVQLRSVGRYAYEDQVPLATLGDQGEMQTRFQRDSNKSGALAVDAGLMWTFADFWFPTLGVAVFNVPTSCKDDYLNPFSKRREKTCGTVYSGDFANPEAVSTIDPTDIRVGLSITARYHRKFAMRIAADLHNIHYQMGDSNIGLAEIPIQKQIHAGLEFITGNPLLPSPFSFSVGVSQGFLTYGASVRLGILALDAVSFGRDISATSTPKEERRNLAGFSLIF